MAKFKKCPRCELNYIRIEEEYCALCKEELKGVVVTEPEEDEEDEDLCPRCKVNYVSDGEKYCEQCLKEIEAEKEKGARDDYWEEEPDAEDLAEDFIDDMLDDADLASLGELADEEFEDDYDDEEEESPDYFEEDDFEVVSPDDYDDEEEEEEDDDYDY
jgi:hypothetical protein